MSVPSPESVRGIVLDLDGTIVANMPLHAQAFAVFAERHGLPPLTREMRARLDGKRNSDIFPILFERALARDEVRTFSAEKEALSREISRGQLRPLPGLVRLLDAADRLAIPVAVATSAPAENVPHTLDQIGLSSRLSRVVRSDEVPRGKPHPDVFLAAARVIDRAPSTCLVFEDSPAGIQAARAADMACAAVTTTFSASDFASHGATPDIAVADFAEFLEGPGAWLIASPA